MSEPYIGEIRPFAINFVPVNWLLCNGDRVSISQYQALFAVINGIYGPTDSRTYFTLPNLQGAAAMHWGAPATPGWPYGSGPQIGAAYGANEVTVTPSNLAPHNHVASVAWAEGTVAMTPAPDTTAIPSRPYSQSATQFYNAWSNATPPVAAGDVMPTDTIGPAGQGAAHENRQPFQAVQFCICYSGVYPVLDN